MLHQANCTAQASAQAGPATIAIYTALAGRGREQIREAQSQCMQRNSTYGTHGPLINRSSCPPKRQCLAHRKGVVGPLVSSYWSSEEYRTCVIPDKGRVWLRALQLLYPQAKPVPFVWCARAGCRLRWPSIILSMLTTPTPALPRRVSVAVSLNLFIHRHNKAPGAKIRVE